MDKGTFNLLTLGWIAIALLLFPVLLKITAPYGRHSSRNWGFTISNRLGWFLMEVPALAVFLFFLFTGRSSNHGVAWIIAMPYIIHYINRSLVYPLHIRTKGKTMPLIIVIMAILFNMVNASLLGYYTGTLQIRYSVGWVFDPRFIAGMIIFFTGMVINLKSDETLIQLRKNSNNGYQIPRGGFFRLVSCPNFFGEIIEWLGYAVLCWSLPALSFFIWTICNLVPRALDHHKWYKNHFPEYPVGRKAVIPFLL